MYTENKQLKDKLDYGLCRASTLGKTQSYFLKFSSASPAAAPFAFSITAKPEQDVLVQQLLVTADKFALATDIRVAGQSINTSDSNIDLSAFTVATKRNTYVGIAIAAEQECLITGNLEAAGTINAGYAVDAIENPPTINSQVKCYDKVFGMGSVSVGGGASAQLTARAVRQVILRDLVLFNTSGVVEDLHVSSITVSGKEMLTGASGSEIPLSIFLATTDRNFGLDMNFPILPSQPVTVTIRNAGAAAAKVQGTFFVENL